MAVEQRARVFWNFWSCSSAAALHAEQRAARRAAAPPLDLLSERATCQKHVGAPQCYYFHSLYERRQNALAPAANPWVLLLLIWVKLVWITRGAHFKAHSRLAAQKHEKKSSEANAPAARLMQWKSYFQCRCWRNHENRMWGNQRINYKANCRRNLKLQSWAYRNKKVGHESITQKCETRTCLFNSNAIFWSFNLKWVFSTQMVLTIMHAQLHLQSETREI